MKSIKLHRKVEQLLKALTAEKMKKSILVGKGTLLFKYGAVKFHLKRKTLLLPGKQTLPR